MNGNALILVLAPLVVVPSMILVLLLALGGVIRWRTLLAAWALLLAYLACTTWALSRLRPPDGPRPWSPAPAGIPRRPPRAAL